jgi:hypothetical protein
MGLSAGTRLGPYEILEPLVAGGWGEVYRAHGTRLERDERAGSPEAVEAAPLRQGDSLSRSAKPETGRTGTGRVHPSALVRPQPQPLVPRRTP